MSAERWHWLRLRWRSLFRPRIKEAELDAEMRFHLEKSTEEHIARGLSPEEACRAARREFGSPDPYREACRDSWGARVFQDMAHDVRYGLRQLNKARGFALVAIFTMAIGIGATTAIFSIVHSVALQPLPYPDSGRLVHVARGERTGQGALQSNLDTYLEIKRQATVFESFAANSTLNVNITGIDYPIHIYGNQVTTNYFSTLGVQPLIGRTFRKEEGEAAHANVTVLSHSLWQELYGGDPSVINRTIQFDGRAHTIVGVMPEGFREEVAGGAKAFVPYVTDEQQQHRFIISVMGRLRPGVDLRQAQTELDVIGSRLREADSEAWGEFQPQVIRMLDAQVETVRPMLYTLLGAVGFLLLIACVNVANLLLARASSRQREIALRTALGASRFRVIRQLLGESVLLATFGGILGTLTAYWSMSVLLSFAPVALPRINEISLDGHALLFSCALTMITGVVFGLVPALQASKVDLTTALKDGSRSSGGSRQGSRLRNCLVITEISLALILLVGAGLLARTFSNIQQAELGYDPNVVHVTRVTPRAPLYPDNQARIDFVDRSLAQLNTKPELVASAFTTGFPLFGARGYRLDIETRSDSDLDNLSWVALSSITPDYFKVMSNTLIRGRWFNERDREDTPLVAIISERVAEQHFPEQNPIGQRIAFTRDDTREWREIVGVVADIRMGGYIRDWSPGVYVPFAQHTTGWRFMPVVRVRPGAPNPGPVVASAIHAVDPNMPIPRDIVCIAEYVANSVATQRFSLFLFGVFSGAALLLAAIGIYGVMAYNVSQRTNELGLRMALGAQKRNIIALVLARAAKLIVIGVVIGVAGALAGSHLLESVLYEISAYDPVTFVGIAVILTAVALLACLLPARRATKVDPMVALRTE